MKTNFATPARSSFFIRRCPELATILYFLFVAQISVYPLTGAPSAAADKTRGLLTVDVTHITFPDAVANFFLYVPFGALIAWSLRRNLRGTAFATIIALLLAGGQSVIIEVLQTQIPSRVSSLYDLIGNVTGAAVGVCLLGVVRDRSRRFVSHAVLEARTRPQAMVLNLYVLLLTFFAALPLTFSFNVDCLKQAAKSANFVPFAAAETQLDAGADVDAARNANFDSLARARWVRMKHWSRWTAECLSFVVLAWLLFAVIRGDYGFRPWFATLLIWWSGAAFAIGLTALQFFILTRACDVTDIIFRVLGLAVGQALRPFVFQPGNSEDRRTTSLSGVRLMRLGAWLVLAFVVFNGLLPMVFDFDPRRAAAAVAAADMIPFFSYVQNRFDVMLDDMSEKLAAWSILCFLLTGSSGSVSPMSTKSRVTSVIVFAFATSVVMEIVQMFIPVRVPSLTDPILAVVGASTGVLAWFVAADFHRFAVADAQREDEAIPGGAMQPVLSLVDSVIASLMEPHSKAPHERAPKRAPTKGK